jgi:hypothetical protein
VPWVYVCRKGESKITALHTTNQPQKKRAPAKKRRNQEEEASRPSLVEEDEQEGECALPLALDYLEKSAHQRIKKGKLDLKKRKAAVEVVVTHAADNPNVSKALEILGIRPEPLSKEAMHDWMLKHNVPIRDMDAHAKQFDQPYGTTWYMTEYERGLAKEEPPIFEVNEGMAAYWSWAETMKNVFQKAVAASKDEERPVVAIKADGATMTTIKKKATTVTAAAPYSGSPSDAMSPSSATLLYLRKEAESQSVYQQLPFLQSCSHLSKRKASFLMVQSMMHLSY